MAAPAGDAKTATNQQQRRIVGKVYVVDKRIGSGSFAHVYRGYHKDTKLKVAIKAIEKSKLNLNRKHQENLEAEIAIMKQLNHPNIVRFYDLIHSERHVYLILEYCAGGDLSHFIRKYGPLPEEVVKRFALHLAAGLRFMRERKLIHRDLKPQNLLLDAESPEAVLKIADFGFARTIQEGSLAATLCGSPLYMAPEILRLQKYDVKADLWSVGTILFEMITGHPPFTGSNQMQLIQRIESSDVRFPPGLVISPELKHLLLSLLRRSPYDRIGWEEFFAHPFLQPKLAVLPSPSPSPSPAAAAVGPGPLPESKADTKDQKQQQPQQQGAPQQQQQRFPQALMLSAHHPNARILSVPPPSAATTTAAAPAAPQQAAVTSNAIVTPARTVARSPSPSPSSTAAAATASATAAAEQPAAPSLRKEESSQQQQRSIDQPSVGLPRPPSNAQERLQQQQQQPSITAAAAAEHHPDAAAADVDAAPLYPEQQQQQPAAAPLESPHVSAPPPTTANGALSRPPSSSTLQAAEPSDTTAVNAAVTASGSGSEEYVLVSPPKASPEATPAASTAAAAATAALTTNAAVPPAITTTTTATVSTSPSTAAAVRPRTFSSPILSALSQISERDAFPAFTALRNRAAAVMHCATQKERAILAPQQQLQQDDGSTAAAASSPLVTALMTALVVYLKALRLLRELDETVRSWRKAVAEAAAGGLPGRPPLDAEVQQQVDALLTDTAEAFRFCLSRCESLRERIKQQTAAATLVVSTPSLSSPKHGPQMSTADLKMAPPQQQLTIAPQHEEPNLAVDCAEKILDDWAREQAREAALDEHLSSGDRKKALAKYWSAYRVLELLLFEAERDGADQADKDTLARLMHSIRIRMDDARKACAAARI